MSENTFGIIAPHPPIMVEAVGGSRASVTADSLKALDVAARALAAFDPDLVVIMSPHAPAFSDTFVVDSSPVLRGSFAQFGAGQARYEYRGDPDFVAALAKRLEADGIPVIDRVALPRLEPGQLDHGVLVPMNFLDHDGRWPLVELSLSFLPYEMHRQVGEAVAETARSMGRRVAFVASGDCSHRLAVDAPAGYSPRGKDLDAALVDHVRRGDFTGLMHLDPDLVEAGGECGLRSFVALGGFVGEGAPTRVLAYEGPWGVGYLTALVGTAALRAAGLADSADTPASGSKGGAAGEPESEIVALARRTIEEYVRAKRLPVGASLSNPELPERAGVFVSLHRQGDLRGCIGTIGPTQPTLADEVIHNAVEAAVNDPRFPPMAVDELADLDVKVDVLQPPEACGIEDLDPKNYGVIVTSGWHRGLLLPDLEGVDDVETQVAIALRKAGLGPNDPCSLERFRVDRYT